MTVDVSPSSRPLWPGFALIALTGRLLARFWPQLVALVLADGLARALLLEVSVRAGFVTPLAGLVALTTVVLAQMMFTVAMFETLRPGMPALAAARRAAFQASGAPAPERRRGARGFAAALTVALVPFFAYYAAWGLLGDAVREYSKLALDLTPFGESRRVLDVLGGGWWLFASVVLSWAVRRGAKAMKARTGAAVWDVVIVVCEANWAFIGLYVLSYWKDDALAWAATLPDLLATFLGITPASAAEAVPPPVEDVGPGLVATAQGLFFYALYPLVWLTLAAIVYGYDVDAADEPAEGRGARALARWRSAPNWLRDVVGHFISGTLKRYQALANGVRLTLGAGAALAITTIVLWRVLDWLAAWAWFGASRALGPHALDLWQALAHGLTILFGGPSAPGDGVLVQPIKICLLAAAIELAFASGRAFRGR